MTSPQAVQNNKTLCEVSNVRRTVTETVDYEKAADESSDHLFVD